MVHFFGVGWMMMMVMMVMMIMMMMVMMVMMLYRTRYGTRTLALYRAANRNGALVCRLLFIAQYHTTILPWITAARSPRVCAMERCSASPRDVPVSERCAVLRVCDDVSVNDVSVSVRYSI